MKLLEDKAIYPEEDAPILEHYQEYFDSVKICFLPFFQMDSPSNISTGKACKKISLEELKSRNEIFKNLGTEGGEIYETVENYPEPTEIIKSGKIIPWSKVVAETDLRNYKEIHKALKTSIGAYRKPLRKYEWLHTLDNYAKINKVWFPIEGQYDIFTKRGIYKLFKNIGTDKIIILDEFYEEKKELDLRNLSQSAFVDQINNKDYYLIAADMSLLFAISWDDFFYFLAYNKEDRKSIDEISEIEGFDATAKDTHLWDWEEGEIEMLLAKAGTATNKPWWQRIFKKKTD